jgi:acyl carrier protein
MQTLNITEVIRTAIAEHARLAVDAAVLADDADLYDAGLTSLATVTLMLALEDALGIEFPESMLSRRTFSSIESIRAGLEQFVEQG